MTKKLLVGFLAAIVLVGLVNLKPAKAQISLNYYKGLFSSWGLSVDTLPQKNTELDVPATKKDLQAVLQILEGGETDQKLTEENIVNTNKEGRYLLLLASQTQVKPQDEVGWAEIIVVCDAPQTSLLPKGVSCASGDLNFADQNPTESSISSKILQAMQPVNTNDVSYYLVSPSLLITPEYQVILGNYFKALSRAENSTNVLDTKGGAESVSREMLKNFRTTSIVESTIYALVLLLFVVALKKPVLMLMHSPKRLLEQSLYINQLQRGLNFLTRNSGMIWFIFLILAIFYLPIFYALTARAQLLGDPSYPVKYIGTTLNPLNIPNYLTAQNLFRVGLLFYHYILALFGFFLIIPSTVRVIATSSRKMKAVKLKANFIKWLLPFMVVLNGLLLAFMELKSLIGLLSLSLVILAAILYYLRSRKIDYSSLYSAKQRRTIVLTVVGIFALTIFYPLFQRNRSVRYVYEPLIGIRDEVVAFPYSKKWGKNVLFEPYYYNGTSQIFADGYLIYSPNAERVVNKPLAKATTMENGIIVSRKPDKVFENLLKKPELLIYLTSKDFSPLFIAKAASKIQITFNCSLDPSAATVRLETLTLNKFVQNERTDSTTNPVSTESTEAMRFPGCGSDAGPETFEVPLDPYIIPQDFALLRIRGIDAKYLAGLKLFAEGKELPVTFIKKEVLNESQYKILYSSAVRSKELIDYSTETKNDFIVDIKKTDQGFDLSVPINELMKKGVLHNPFIIWTDKPYEIIESGD